MLFFRLKARANSTAESLTVTYYIPIPILLLSHDYICPSFGGIKNLNVFILLIYLTPHNTPAVHHNRSRILDRVLLVADIVKKAEDGPGFRGHTVVRPGHKVVLA